MGLSEKSKPVSAPGYKVIGNWMDGDELPPERRKALRCASMSLAYLATDWRELQCPSKDAAMMQKPPIDRRALAEGGGQVPRRSPEACRELRAPAPAEGDRHLHGLEPRGAHTGAARLDWNLCYD